MEEFVKDETKGIEGGTNSCGDREREMGNREKRGFIGFEEGKRVGNKCGGEEGMAGCGKGEKEEKRGGKSGRHVWRQTRNGRLRKGGRRNRREGQKKSKERRGKLRK